MKTSTIQAKTAADDPLAALFARREEIAAEIARLTGPASGVAAAEAKLQVILDGLAAIDRAEAESWQRWAENEGPEPTPLIEERLELGRRRLDAQTELDAARVAYVAIEKRMNHINAELVQIKHEIFDVRLAGVVDQAKAAHREAVEAAAKVAGPMLQVIALRDLLAAEIGAAHSVGDRRREAALAAAFGALDGLRPPVVEGDNAELALAAARWREAIL